MGCNSRPTPSLKTFFVLYILFARALTHHLECLAPYLLDFFPWLESSRVLSSAKGKRRLLFIEVHLAQGRRQSLRV